MATSTKKITEIMFKTIMFISGIWLIIAGFWFVGIPILLLSLL